LEDREMKMIFGGSGGGSGGSGCVTRRFHCWCNPHPGEWYGTYCENDENGTMEAAIYSYCENGDGQCEVMY